MEIVTATIRDGSKILVKNIEVWISATESPGGLLDRDGHFDVPQGLSLEAGGPFELETTDNRSCQIIFTSVDADRANFIVTGPFG